MITLLKIIFRLLQISSKPFFNKVESLLENPNRGRVVPESNRENIRELFEGEYRMIYRVEKNYISVLTTRNFKQLLPDTDLE